MVLCNCRQYERIGTLCSHTLKVLDMMNIKVLHAHYILKRWTREARCDIVEDIHGNNVIENLKIDATQCYQNLSCKFLSIASRAADYGEVYSYVDNVLNTLHRDVDEKIKNSLDISAN
jgi:zinc finger SWIM domain-containing protein 3